MSLEIGDIAEADIQELPGWTEHGDARDAGCRHCLYWEQPAEFEQPTLTIADREAVKARWFRNVASEFGCAGKLARLDGVLVGYSQFAPARYLPTASEYQCGPPSEDAVLVSCLLVVRERRGEGLGSALLGVVLEELQGRNVTSAESFARKTAGSNPSGPLQFWLKHGFRSIREDAEFALVRKELA